MSLCPRIVVMKECGHKPPCWVIFVHLCFLRILCTTASLQQRGCKTKDLSWNVKLLSRKHFLCCTGVDTHFHRPSNDSQGPAFSAHGSGDPSLGARTPAARSPHRHCTPASACSRCCSKCRCWGTWCRGRTPRPRPPWSSRTLCCCVPGNTPGTCFQWSYRWTVYCSLKTS